MRTDFVDRPGVKALDIMTRHNAIGPLHVSAFPAQKLMKGPTVIGRRYTLSNPFDPVPEIRHATNFAFFDPTHFPGGRLRLKARLFDHLQHCRASAVNKLRTELNRDWPARRLSRKDASPD